MPKCNYCGKQLTEQNTYETKDGQTLCRPHFDRHLFLATGTADAWAEFIAKEGICNSINAPTCPVCYTFRNEPKELPVSCNKGEERPCLRCMGRDCWEYKKQQKFPSYSGFPCLRPRLGNLLSQYKRLEKRLIKIGVLPAKRGAKKGA